MYIIYADESGDTGLRKKGGSSHFYISGLIVHETNWNQLFQNIVDFRRELSKRYKVNQRIPFHGTDIVNGHGDYHHTQAKGLTTTDRFRLYHDILRFLASQKGLIHLLNVGILKDKILKRDLDVFDWAWKFFIQRFHNTIDTGGELARGDECGLLISDRTHDVQLRRLMRQMRAYNIVPGHPGLAARNILVKRILDDPIPRESRYSYLVQMADVVAYALARRDFPRPKLAPYRFETYFDVLNPVLLTSASGSNSQGIFYWPS